MKNLVQLAYASRSTYVSPATSRGVEPSIARILATSRANNRKNGLVGVLYYGDNCFFQCLEGEEAAVETLYEKLLRDDRHTDIKLIVRRPIVTSSFSEWAMKYVPIEKHMENLLRENGFEKFDPYAFDAAMTDRVISLLCTAQQPLELVPESPVAPISGEPQGAVGSGRLAKTAFIVSVLALLVAIAALALSLSR
jgi:hypothetical protein